MKRGPATSEKRGMYHGIQVPLDAFEKPFAGGSEVDALPARLESIVFPQRCIFSLRFTANDAARDSEGQIRSTRRDKTEGQDEPVASNVLGGVVDALTNASFSISTPPLRRIHPDGCCV